MRRRKSDLHARVNRNLPLEFDDVRLTSYAGLELLERYLRTRRFNQLVREAFADLPRWGDFGVVVMVRVFVGLVIVGGRRLRHLAYVADDPIFQRFGNVRVVPTARTLSRWLRHFTMRTVTRFQALNAAVVRQLLPTLGLRTWTVDVDGVVVCRYNPHGRWATTQAPRTTHILRRGQRPRWEQPVHQPKVAQLRPDHGAPGWPLQERRMSRPTSAARVGQACSTSVIGRR